MGRTGATPAMTWAFRLQGQPSTGGCPGSHLSSFLCKPNRCSQQRNRNQTRKMRRLQKRFIGGLLLGTAGPAGAPPFLLGSAFAAVCSLLKLPLQQESAERWPRRWSLEILLHHGKSSYNSGWVWCWRSHLPTCVLNTNTLMENESALFGLLSRGLSD